MAYINRRNVLRGSAALGFTSATGLLSAMNAAQAADTTGYKALVCLFLKGGHDGADIVLSKDTESYDELKTRGRICSTATGWIRTALRVTARNFWS